MPEYRFDNVTITIEAPTGRHAYERLCAALCTEDALEFHTDTFCIPINCDDDGPVMSTSRLFPDAADPFLE